MAAASTQSMTRSSCRLPPRDWVGRSKRFLSPGKARATACMKCERIVEWSVMRTLRERMPCIQCS
jgi:hypothetical protein